MAEKCTNTSSPVERWINPYPFAPLNHFTVPFSLTKTPFALSLKYSSVSYVLSRGSRTPPQRTVRIRLRTACGRTLQHKRLPKFHRSTGCDETAWSRETKARNIELPDTGPNLDCTLANRFGWRS